MLSCREVTQLCSEELERPLSLWERLSLKTHLMMCSGCSNFRAQMGAIRQAMRTFAEGRSISGDRKEDRDPRP